MKKTFIIASVVACMATSALAQSSSGSYSASGSASQAGASSDSQSAAYGGQSSSGVIYAPTVNNPSKTKNSVNYDGDYTIRSAPQVSAPSMGSGHPCGLGGSLGISIVGGGATGGATRVDTACMLAQMGLTDAAVAMYAARDPAVCRALLATGRISSASYCGSGSATPTASTKAKTASPAKPTALLSKCENDGGKVRISYTSAGKKNKALAKSQCLASLGF